MRVWRGIASILVHEDDLHILMSMCVEQFDCLGVVGADDTADGHECVSGTQPGPCGAPVKVYLDHLDARAIGRCFVVGQRDA